MDNHDIKHTPGPWYVSYDTVSIRQFNSQQSPFIADTAGTENGEANARLIAAAPDLLEACQIAARLFEGACFPGPILLSIGEVRIIKEAVAKATEN